MSKTPEAKVKDKIKAWLKAHGIWYFMPIGGPFTVHGIPDLVCCAPGGRFIGIEVKAPGKRGNTTPNQEQRLQEIRDHGGVAVVVDDVAQLEELLHG